MEENNLIMPSFKLEGKMPHVRLRSIRFVNFKVFEDYLFDFSSEDGIKDFICFIGPNGEGKSTMLNAIQLVFSRIEGRDLARVKTNLGKAVRHVKKYSGGGVYGDEDFLITAQIESSLGDYEVQINKSGFVKDHPQEIKNLIYRICYTAKFDQELNRFQLAREKWPEFKEMFETVTGYTVEENKDIEMYLAGSSDVAMKNLVENYVLSFFIHKPTGTISEREASDGEKKVIKSFSTLLTIEYTPQIILVDNIEMHVEKKRHMRLIEQMKKCYPESQIFSTTHSYYITKILGKQAGIEDLRLIRANAYIKKEPWRLRVIDEIEEALLKVSSFKDSEKTSELVKLGENILVACYGEIKDLQLFYSDVKKFLEGVLEIFISNVLP